MNLLAHAYLSQHHPKILLGNMLGDDVKGKQIVLYPPMVRVGIQLHRYIDSYTDQQPQLSKAKDLFRPYVGLYAGALTDISMDYFLARDPAIHTYTEWQNFAQWAYQQLQYESSWHSGGFKRYFPYLKSENWFIKYRDTDFIKGSMTNLLKRTRQQEKTPFVLSAFDQHQQILKESYQAFFPLLQAYVSRMVAQLTLNIPGSQFPTKSIDF